MFLNGATHQNARNKVAMGNGVHINQFMPIKIDIKINIKNLKHKKNSVVD